MYQGKKVTAAAIIWPLVPCPEVLTRPPMCENVERGHEMRAAVLIGHFRRAHFPLIEHQHLWYAMFSFRIPVVVEMTVLYRIGQKCNLNVAVKSKEINPCSDGLQVSPYSDKRLVQFIASAVSCNFKNFVAHVLAEE